MQTLLRACVVDGDAYALSAQGGDKQARGLLARVQAAQGRREAGGMTITDEPERTILDQLRGDLADYEAQAAIVVRLIEDGDDCEWNTRRLSGWQWNIAQTKAKIAREERAA
jgi:hypothetical protein